MNPDEFESQIRPLIEQLYGDERLTDELKDEEGQMLLEWGEKELRGLSYLEADQAELENIARQLRRVMRTINALIGQRAGLSDTQLLQRLFRLVEQASRLANQRAVTKSDFT